MRLSGPTAEPSERAPPFLPGVGNTAVLLHPAVDVVTRPPRTAVGLHLIMYEAPRLTSFMPHPKLNPMINPGAQIYHRYCL